MILRVYLEKKHVREVTWHMLVVDDARLFIFQFHFHNLAFAESRNLRFK